MAEIEYAKNTPCPTKDCSGRYSTSSANDKFWKMHKRGELRCAQGCKDTSPKHVNTAAKIVAAPETVADRLIKMQEAEISRLKKEIEAKNEELKKVKTISNKRQTIIDRLKKQLEFNKIQVADEPSDSEM